LDKAELLAQVVKLAVVAVYLAFSLEVQLLKIRC
jgi:hypothetical protein